MRSRRISKAQYRAFRAKQLNGGVSDQGAAVARLNAPVSHGKRGQYKLGYSYTRDNLTREREAKRKAKLHELWGNHANAVLAKAMAKDRSAHLITLVNNGVTTDYLDKVQRERQQRAKLVLKLTGDTHVTYARLSLSKLKDQPNREWPVLRAYHRQPQFQHVGTRKRFTNGRDVWATYKVA